MKSLTIVVDVRPSSTQSMYDEQIKITLSKSNISLLKEEMDRQGIKGCITDYSSQTVTCLVIARHERNMGYGLCKQTKITIIKHFNALNSKVVKLSIFKNGHTKST